MRCVALLLVLASFCAHAEDKPAQLPPVKPGYTVLPESDDLPGIEPKIEHIVHEDRSTRIDEWRVRGAATKAKVHTKNFPAPDYEVLVEDAGQYLFPDRFGAIGPAGRRVWEVLEY